MSNAYELDIEPVELSPQEWKLLFMMIAENRADLNFREALTPYGISLLEELRRNLAINVVGIDVEDGNDGLRTEPTFCPVCKQTLIYNALHDLDELTLRTLYGDR